MRTKSNILMWLLSLAAVLGLCMSVNSCQPEGLVDDSEFSLYYPGISDIGPSSIISVTPTWHGATPNNFEIYQVTLEGKNFTEGIDAFKVDPETGVVTLSETENLPVGTYMISVACSSNGKRFDFPDCIRVNMMKGVPDGITVEPAHLEVKLADIISGTNLPTAQITTDGNHVTIKKYLIAGVRKDGAEVSNADELFKLSKDGLLSIVGKNNSFIPGMYEIDFKLTTSVFGEQSEEGLFVKALTLDVTSEPLELTYTPAEGLAEAGYEFHSLAPAMTGSTAELKYEIAAVDPACDALKINETTGDLYFEAKNTLNVGDKYSIDIKVTNKYGSKTFEGAYDIEVVAFIAPITKLSYGNVAEVIQTCSFSNPMVECDGDNVVYSFKNLPETLKGLEIDGSTGLVTAPKKNNFPIGTHTITILAKNTKGEKEATFTVNIIPNPYMFTYVHWGNNLDLTPANKFASQFRFHKGDKDIKIAVKESDLPKDFPAKFTLAQTHCKGNNPVINPETGEITVSYGGEWNTEFAFITVEVGEGEAKVSKKFPVFFSNSFAAPSGNTIEYSPFAICINPEKGGNGPAPKVWGKDGSEISLDMLSIDYRRTFNYYNLNGPATHQNGDPSKPGAVHDAWARYYEAIKKPFNAGARKAVSYWENKSNLSIALMYFRTENGALTVNPGKFVDNNGVYANGVFMGQAPFIVTGKTDPAGSEDKIFPIAVWFDTKFE